MQPRPWAETSRPSLPSVRFCMSVPPDCGLNHWLAGIGGGETGERPRLHRASFVLAPLGHRVADGAQGVRPERARLADRGGAPVDRARPLEQLRALDGEREVVAER